MSLEGNCDDKHTYLGKTSFVMLTLGLKYGLFESAKKINTSDSETERYHSYFNIRHESLDVLTNIKLVN